LKTKHTIETLPVLPNFKKLIEGDYGYLYLKYRKPKKGDDEVFKEIYKDFLNRRKENQYDYIKIIEAQNFSYIFKINQTLSVIKILRYAKNRSEVLKQIESDILELSINVNKLVLRYNILKKSIVKERDIDLIKQLNNLTGGRFNLKESDSNFYEKLTSIENSLQRFRGELENNKKILENLQKGEFNWGIFLMQVSKWHGNIDLKNTTLSELVDLLGCMDKEGEELKKKKNGKVIS
jgi:hypothetical protein